MAIMANHFHWPEYIAPSQGPFYLSTPGNAGSNRVEAADDSNLTRLAPTLGAAVNGEDVSSHREACPSSAAC